MTREGVKFCAACDIPDPGSLVRGTRNHFGTVGVKSGLSHPVIMSHELAGKFLCRGFPNGKLVVESVHHESLKIA